MIQGLTNKQDIKVIHSIVSDELKAQIEKAFPELFPELFYQKQYDFTEFIDLFNKHDLPFTVGKKLCTKNEDMNKCLIVYSCYKAEVELQDNGYQKIRFFEK